MVNVFKVFQTFPAAGFPWFFVSSAGYGRLFVNTQTLLSLRLKHCCTTLGGSWGRRINFHITHLSRNLQTGCVSAVLGLFCKSASLYNIIVCTFKILCFGGALVWDSVMPRAWPYMKKFFTCIMEKTGDSQSHQRSFFGDLMNILYFTAINAVLIQCDRTTICLTDIPAQMARNALIMETHKL